MARIAVVIPVHDRSAIVRRAIDSVLAQDFADFELIVVDDASSDGTADIVAAIEDPRLRLLRQPGCLGGNAARNRGIRETAAPLIALLDSDDEYLPAKLATVVEAFDRQPDLGALLDSYAIAFPDRHGGKPQPRINPATEASDDFLAALFGSSAYPRRLRVSASGISLRRDVAIRAGLFDETIRRRQDFEFLARVAKAARCASSDRQLWIKHETGDSITAIGPGYMAATIAICRRHPEYLEDRRLRGALSRDIVRHLHRALRAGRWAAFREDFAMLRAEFGLARLLGLIARRALPHRARRRRLRA